jgi:hypothetical protein
MQSSSKTSQPCAPEDSIACSPNLTASGLMRRGQLSKLEPPASTSDEPGSSCWPSPTVSDHNASRRHGYTITGHSGTTLTDAMLEWYGLAESKDPPRVLNPDFCEALLALPEGWTNVDDESACAALETPSPQIRLF